jgi:hypothetical protein
MVTLSGATVLCLAVASGTVLISVKCVFSPLPSQLVHLSQKSIDDPISLFSRIQEKKGKSFC